MILTFFFRICALNILLIIASEALGQIDTNTNVTQVSAPDGYKGDTILYRRIQNIIVTDKKGMRTPEEEEAYQKLKRRVIKLYPYALLAKQLVETTNQDVSKLASNSEKRKYLKAKEQELRDRFEDEIKGLYTTDGPVLVKLIHRETGKTCHEIIGEHKSWFNMMLYQMAAKRHGYSLKDTYNPEVDIDIENMVQLLKSEGQLPIHAR